MKRQRWFWMVLVVAVLFSWIQIAAASSVTFDFGGYAQNYYRAMGASYNPIETASWEYRDSLLITPTTVGVVSQQKSFGGSLSGTYEVPETCQYNLPGPYNVTVGINFFDHVYNPYHDVAVSSLNYTLTLVQSGSLRFTDLTMEVKWFQGGSEITFLTMYINAETFQTSVPDSYTGCPTSDFIRHFMQNGGWINIYADQANVPIWAYMDIPVSWTNIGELFDYGFDRYVGSGSWSGDGPIFTLSITEHVIDTTVPIPSALLLVGSGLLRLGLYGKRRLACRS